ncbi:MAG: hypothetical protein Q8J69_07680 [Sphingobacteriaceae bacterium]|nr:hypothetical protein [Sphingobacteriaceae bacterium]
MDFSKFAKDKIEMSHFTWLGFKEVNGALVKDGFDGEIQFIAGHFWYCKDNKAVKKIVLNEDIDQIYLAQRNLEPKMKVFKIFEGNLVYCYAALTQELALTAHFVETECDYDKVEEVLETEWDKKFIDVYEDNDFDKKPFKMSIRESITGTNPQLIFTNDMSMIS